MTSSDVRFEYTVTLAPRDVPLASAHDTQRFTLTAPPDKSLLDQPTLTQRALDRGVVDRYALRSHWRIAKVSATFANAPWVDFRDLVDDLSALAGVEQVTVRRRATELDTVFVERSTDITDSELYAQLDDYYPGLLPRPHGNQNRVAIKPRELPSAYVRQWSPDS